MVDPDSVRALAKSLWTHSRFAQRHIYYRPEASVTEEYAARYAARFGDPSEPWLLDQARNRGVGARALWALIDEGMRKRLRDGRADGHYEESIATELIRVASDRFGSGGRFNLEELHYWGRLWLVLGAATEAEQTANAIIASQLKDQDRGHRILALKLLAFAASKRKPTPAIENQIASLYNQLWQGHTLAAERAEREQIDGLLA